MRYRTIAAGAAAAALLFGAAACGGSSGPGDDGTGSVSDTASSGAPTDIASGSDSSSAGNSSSGGSSGAPVNPADVKYTPQGTQLKLGEKAIVPFKYTDDKQGAIGITVRSVEKGDVADLQKISDDDVSGETPYYVNYTVTNESGTDLSYASDDGVSGVAADASSVKSYIVIGSFDPCPSESAPRDFTTAGASYDSCSLLSTSGSTLTTIVYDALDGDDLNVPNTNYFEHPITWKVS